MQWRGWPHKHAPPHVCYRAEFCHSTLNIGAPQNGERWGSGPTRTWLGGRDAIGLKLEKTKVKVKLQQQQQRMFVSRGSYSAAKKNRLMQLWDQHTHTYPRARSDSRARSAQSRAQLPQPLDGRCISVPAAYS